MAAKRAVKKKKKNFVEKQIEDIIIEYDIKKKTITKKRYSDYTAEMLIFIFFGIMVGSIITWVVWDVGKSMETIVLGVVVLCVIMVAIVICFQNKKQKKSYIEIPGKKEIIITRKSK